MTCPVCQTYQRDLNDIAREVQTRRSTPARIDLDLEIRALASAKAQIEAKYSKHRSLSH
jgi:hypothetical protein